MPRRLSVRTAYRRWYAAAGPWAGYFRAVPLVALARGIGTEGESSASSQRATRQATQGRGASSTPRSSLADGAQAADVAAAELVAVGQAERWLGRPDVLLLLDLPSTLSVRLAARLGPYGVSPVLLLLQWPEPGALVTVPDLPSLLLSQAAVRPARSDDQYAFVLGAERTRPASPSDLALHFDNRYTLGLLDLPAPRRLREEGVLGVVACRQGDAAWAADMAAYLEALARAELPLRELPLSGAGAASP